jgi:SAM-dependent methyltransferase
MSSARSPLLAGPGKPHWDGVYGSRAANELSWYQPEPEMSLALIDDLRLEHDAAIVDVGGGASRLARRLLDRGFTDVTVLDVSARALGLARSELGVKAAAVHWIEQDLLSWTPQRQYDVWHDRAVFHFLVDPAHRERYVEILRSAVCVGGAVVIGTFAADGPTTCSRLPVARYGPDLLATELGEGFVTLATRREEHRTPSHALQPFTWVALERTACQR